MPITTANAKKQALLAHKEKLLQDIKYYEKKIEDFNTNISSNTYFEDDSSDYEDDFPSTITIEPSVQQLEQQQAMLRTCLHATQELTSLEILQSEVNVLVVDPVIDRELPVKEPGLWREVTAECCIDLVPFSITFYVHQPSRQFGPTSYRSLKVLPVKRAHEAELTKSVLPGVNRPSDAIEVLRSYAAANRSRRTTLAKLADKFARHLFMEPMVEGGYILKCANVLELSWRLENKRSSVAAFHHRMNFNLEYLDESYIRIITQAHKQLSDPSIQTDERTLLLATIITTCLEAQGNQEFSESMESDTESIKKTDKRPAAQENEAPGAKKKKEDAKDTRESETDDQIMAPPKTLPKKVKPKGKENLDDNRKSVKRPNAGESGSYIKKAKTVTNEASEVNVNRKDLNAQNDIENVTAEKEADKENVINKNNPQKRTEKESAKSAENVKNVKKINHKENSDKDVGGSNSKNAQKVNSNEKNTENVNQQEKTRKNTKETAQKVASTKNDPKSKETEVKKVDKDKQVENTKTDAKLKNPKGLAKNDPRSKNSEAETTEKNNAASAKNDPKQKKTDGLAKNDPKNKNSKAETAEKSNAARAKNDPKNKNSEETAEKSNAASAKNDPKNKNSEETAEKSNAASAKNDPKQKKIDGLAKHDPKNKHSKAKTAENSNAASAKNDPKQKKTESLANNEPKNKNSKAETVEKNNAARAKNDLRNKNLAETTEKRNAASAKNDPKLKNTDDLANNEPNSKAGDKDIASTKVKKTKSNQKMDNGVISTQTEKSRKNNEKSEGSQKPDEIANQKTAVKDKDKNSKKNNPYAKNDQNIETDSAHFNKKSVDKESVKNADRVVDSKKNPKDIVASNKNENMPENNANKAEKSEKESSKNKLKKTNAQKSAPKNLIIPINISPIKKLPENNTDRNRDGIEKVYKVKNVAMTNKEHISNRTFKVANVNNIPKAVKSLSHKNSQNKLTKHVTGNINSAKTGKTWSLKTGNIIKENGNSLMDKGSAIKTSRIPQKKLSPASESNKNSLRTSPRIATIFKSTSDSYLRQKISQKAITNIPRLLKKQDSTQKMLF